MMAKTIKAIKVWVRREENRLKQRRLNASAMELNSLEGSLITIRKLKEYINQ